MIVNRFMHENFAQPRLRYSNDLKPFSPFRAVFLEYWPNPVPVSFCRIPGSNGGWPQKPLKAIFNLFSIKYLMVCHRGKRYFQTNNILPPIHITCLWWTFILNSTTAPGNHQCNGITTCSWQSVQEFYQQIIISLPLAAADSSRIHSSLPLFGRIAWSRIR